MRSLHCASLATAVALLLAAIVHADDLVLEPNTKPLTLRHDGPGIVSVAWSPDGKRLASADVTGTIKVWDPAAAKEKLSVKVSEDDHVTSVVWSPGGEWLASAGASGTVKVWDAATAKEKLTENLGVNRAQGDYVRGLAWSADGKRFAVGSAIEVKAWDITTGKELLRGNIGGVSGLEWSPDGKRLALGGWNPPDVRVWDMAAGKVSLTYEHAHGVGCVAWSPDGKRLASSSRDTVKVWDALTGKDQHFFLGHTNWIETMVWSPDGKKLACGSVDMNVKVRDTATGREIYTLREKSEVGGKPWVGWSPDGNWLATAKHEKTVKVWDAATGKQTLELREGNLVRTGCLAWSPDGKHLATGCAGSSTVIVWSFVRDRNKKEPPLRVKS